ncbi:hypothetical protein JVT61DRAFT_13852 [Boletus reticuloceps]|uniref:Uncharacterized protein n=1 Tax=Boletus reticuloceps TaxID=495285 RepID=A0A8I2YV17_9AGAM|nr:hypothetical protein JVT61DRAFT_13852 [Boletus reticuloceps]
MRVDSDDTFPSQTTQCSVEANVKRKAIECRAIGHRVDTNEFEPSSPEIRKGVSHKNRFIRLRRHAHLRQHHQDKILGFTFVPPESVFEVEEDEAKAGTPETHSQETDDPPLETSRSREAEIAESIRKLRELEKDRPLWEAERKKREAHERAEEEERLAKAERRRREEEEELRQQREAAEQEKRLVQEEAERRAREEELRQRKNRQRQQRQRWESGPWTTHRALERYRMLSDEFDTAKFTPGQSDVDWSAVETFFATVKPHMRLQDYKEFVEKSHRRFHPDRWRARKIWAAVTDEVERGYLEVAANTVAQALTPIWRVAKEK